MREPMITHRKYFSILFIMLVIVFMFVFTQVAKESISDYDVNAHAAKPIDMAVLEQTVRAVIEAQQR